MLQMTKDILDNIDKTLSFKILKSSILADFRLALMSREVSLIGRREVLAGRAKFGILEHGKNYLKLLSKSISKWRFSLRLLPDQTFYAY